MKHTVAVLFFLLAFLFLARAQQPEKKALVIGNAAYKASPLVNTEHDARNMDAILTQLGFKSSLLINATRNQMYESILQFADSLKSGDTALFYYAGHGFQIRGTNYLIPLDMDTNNVALVPYTSLPLEFVFSRLADTGSVTNILILDACRDNPFPGSERSSARGLASETYPVPGTLVVYATSPGSVANEGSGTNGIFTGSLLRRIASPGLDVESLLRLVRDDVIAETAGTQIPWSSSSLRGEGFCFNPTGREILLSQALAQPDTQVQGAVVSLPVVEVNAVRQVKTEEGSGTLVMNFEKASSFANWKINTAVAKEYTFECVDSMLMQTSKKNEHYVDMWSDIKTIDLVNAKKIIIDYDMYVSSQVASQNFAPHMVSILNLIDQQWIFNVQVSFANPLVSTKLYHALNCWGPDGSGYRASQQSNYLQQEPDGRYTRDVTAEGWKYADGMAGSFYTARIIIDDYRKSISAYTKKDPHSDFKKVGEYVLAKEIGQLFAEKSFSFGVGFGVQQSVGGIKRVEVRTE